MNLQTIKSSLKYLFKQRITPLLVSQHGMGKSSSVRQLTDEEGIGFIDLRLGQMETGDLLGLPDITVDEQGNKVTVFARPKWFPTEGRGILFLDEINRAKRDVLQAIFQLVLDRKIHDYVLPDGWNIVAAQNPSTEDYNVTEFDKALNDRFCQIKVTSSYEDFLRHGEVSGFNKSVLNFINAQPEMLRGSTQDFNLSYVTPSDRSWEMAGKLVDDPSIPEGVLNELLSGLVGVEGATAFMAWKKTNEKPVSGELVLSNYKKVQKLIQEQCDATNYRPDLINATKQQVLDILKERKQDDTVTTSDKQYKNLVAFMMDIPNDVFVGIIKESAKLPNKGYLQNFSQEEVMQPKIIKCVAEKEANAPKEPTAATEEVAT